MSAVLETLELSPLEPGGYPRLAFRMCVGWLVATFYGAELIQVRTFRHDQVPESLQAEAPGTLYLRAHGVDYSGDVCLRPHGWGRDPEHRDHFMGYRRQREGDPGWCDRLASFTFHRRGSQAMVRASEAASQVLLGLIETAVAEIVADRPALVEIGEGAMLRGEIDCAERDLVFLYGKITEKTKAITELRTALNKMED